MEAIDRIWHIAAATSSIKSDTLGRYIMSRPSQSRSYLEASSTNVPTVLNVEAYRAVRLPILGDTCNLSEEQKYMDMTLYFVDDLLHAYSYIANIQRIPLQDVTYRIRDTQWGT